MALWPKWVHHPDGLHPSQVVDDEEGEKALLEEWGVKSESGRAGPPRGRAEDNKEEPSRPAPRPGDAIRAAHPPESRDRR